MGTAVARSVFNNVNKSAREEGRRPEDKELHRGKKTLNSLGLNEERRAPGLGSTVWGAQSLGAQRASYRFRIWVPRYWLAILNRGPRVWGPRAWGPREPATNFGAGL